jgi:hypothetical protein
MAVAPGQIEVGEDTAVIVGFAFTVTEIVFVLEQPALPPVTVYIVLLVGLTTIVAPFKPPGFHV